MIKNFYHKIKLRKLKRDLIKNCVVPLEYTTIMHTVGCTNTGNRENVVIGSHCTLGVKIQAFFGGKVTIGNNTYIGPSTIIQAKESVQVGNSVIIANNVLIVDNNNHPTDPIERQKMSLCKDFLNDELWSWKYAESKPIIIEDNVWIGRDARILKGVTVGRGSIVAMGAVVSHDVPSYTIVAGNPAKVVKHLNCPGEKSEEI